MNSEKYRFLRHRQLLAAVAILGTLVATTANAWDTTYMRGLLQATPEGGWVKASNASFSTSWASVAEGGLPSGSYSDPGAIVSAWSSFAWDSNRGNLILWGGGHANYMGNEIYLWQASTGAWTRGSLPSRLVSGASIPGTFSGEYFVVDSAAPQSAHTYENNLFLPLTDRFITFGGAAFNSGGGLRTLDANGVPTAAGPWMWDPAKANAGQVGGTTGSGYLPATVGGEMWTNRITAYTGTRGGGPLESTTAYRQEAGKDVVYLTRDTQASGFPSLYRYEPGDLAAGGLDRWDKVAVAGAAANYQSSGAIDTDHGLYVRTAFSPYTLQKGLGVWDLSRINAQNPETVGDTFISLVYADGSPFSSNVNQGLAYDELNNEFVLWDGSAGGTVFYVAPQFAPNGALATTWTVSRQVSTSAAQPSGNFTSAAGDLGVLGKWQYIPELGAFMALDMFNPSTNDAPVWLYKPFTTPVPELGTTAMMLFGLLVLGLQRLKLRTESARSGLGRHQV